MAEIEYKEIKYYGKNVLVEAAKKDGNGNDITKTYLTKQDGLTKDSLKTINGISLYGSGDITITGSDSSNADMTYVINAIVEHDSSKEAHADIRDGLDTIRESLTSYLTKDIADSTYATIDSLQSAIETIPDRDLSNYVTNDYASTNYVNVSTLDNYSTTEANDLKYATKSELSDYIKTSDLVNPKKEITQLENKNIDYILNDGKYFVKNAKNPPMTKDSDGLVEVEKVSDTKFSQSWISDTYSAFRLATSQTELRTDSEVYVNGVLTNVVDNVLELTAGGTYELSGYLYGQIKITTSEDLANVQSTTLVLKGLGILSKEESAIVYDVLTKRLYVNVIANTYNYMKVDVESPSDSPLDSAVLYSMNNMSIIGSGYLSVETNTYNHGIKASELTIGGNAHIYVSALHDAIHGSSVLQVENGYIYIANGKDGFGTGETGSICVYGGNIHIENVSENGFDSKQEGIIQGFNTKISYETCSGGVVSDTITVLEPVSINGVVSKTFNEYFQAGHVYNCTIDESGNISDGVEILPVNNVYTFSSAIHVVGYIEGELYTTTQSLDVYLDNVFVTYGGDAPTIYYNASKKKLGIKVIGKTNYVIQTATDKKTYTTTNKTTGLQEEKYYDYDAIKSENNIKFSKSGTIICKSELGDAADGSDFILSGDGTKYFINSGERGIKGKTICIGADPDDISAEKAENSYQNIYCLGNSQEPDNYDINGRNGGNSAGSLTIYSYQKGAVVARTISAHDSGSCESENVLTVEEIVNSVAPDNIIIDEHFNINDYNNTFVTEVTKLSGTWFRNITSDDLDAKLSAIEARLSALENK